MKTYQKAELIAKNLPTGSYAAGCPQGRRAGGCGCLTPDGNFHPCSYCEIAE